MNVSKTTVIFSGGLLNEQQALDTVAAREEVFIIGADSGVKFLYEHKIRPDYIVGDFDSLEKDILDFYDRAGDIPIQKHNPVKDATDTEIALELAMEIGFREIILLGATGARIDHLWANVQTLLLARQRGFEAMILDEYNRIRIIDSETILDQRQAYGPYFSVFALGGAVKHFNIRGAKYPLSDHTLEASGSLCVSNEFLAAKVKITFPEGNVILMETKDRRK